MNKTKVRSAEIEDIRQFTCTYLGSVISTSGGTDEDIQARKKNPTNLCNPQTNLKEQSPHNINKHQNLQLKRKISSSLRIRDSGFHQT